jgi:hypothetical protein
MRVEIQVRSGHLSWRKTEDGSKEINCPALFEDFWNTKAHEFLVQGQLESPTVLPSLTEKAQRTLLLGSIVALWNYISLQKLLFVFRQFPTAGLLISSHRRIHYAPRFIN